MTEHASLRVIQEGCLFSWPTELQSTLLESHCYNDLLLWVSDIGSCS